MFLYCWFILCIKFLPINQTISLFITKKKHKPFNYVKIITVIQTRGVSGLGCVEFCFFNPIQLNSIGLDWVGFTFFICQPNPIQINFNWIGLSWLSDWAIKKLPPLSVLEQKFKKFLKLKIVRIYYFWTE